MSKKKPDEPPPGRTLNRLVITDKQEADRIFSTLMGKDVRARRDFIMKHAKEAKNIDV